MNIAMDAATESCQKMDEISNFRHIPGTKIFRSSRPDKLQAESLEKFLDLNISSIIDLRSMREFPSASGPKSIDDHYQVVSVEVCKTGDVSLRKVTKLGKLDDTVQRVQLSCNTDTADLTDGTSKLCCNLPIELEPHQRGIHFVFDLVSVEYGRAVLARTSWFIRSFLYSCYAVDQVFGTNMFMKGLVQYAINSRGLLGQYKDIIDHCGQKICAVLKTLCDPGNAPLLVNCTYGKDRTGIIVALTLSVLGFDTDFIATDYSKSGPELEKSKVEVTGYLQNLNFNKSFFESNYSVMSDLLTYINDKYASVADYLCHIGFDHQWQEQMKTSLLERGIADQDQRQS